MRCKIPGLVVPKDIPACDACTKGKMHKLGPVSSSSVEKTREIYLPGEYMITDFRGPM